MGQYSYLTVLFLLVFSFSSFAQVNRCDSTRHTHYSTRFFMKSGIDLKTYTWEQPHVNCHINKAEQYKRNEKAFIGMTGLFMGVGVGLVATGFGIGHPKSETTKHLQTILALSGVASLTVSIPFAALHQHYKRKAISTIQKARPLVIP